MKNIILAGSGHAHLEVLKALTKEEIESNRFLLISPDRRTFYSGLIPRLIAGQITANQLTIDSADLAESKGITFLNDSLSSIDASTKTISMASGRIEKFDVLSVNIGGSQRRIPSESPMETIYLRPFGNFLDQWRRVEHQFMNMGMNMTQPKFVVVGGGAAAVEVATALQLRLMSANIWNGEIHLISESERLCMSFAEKVSKQIATAADRIKIKIHLNEPVREISVKHLVLKNGQSLTFDAIFIATPNVPSSIIAHAVDSFLQFAPGVFASGDCATMAEYPNLPKSGVIAVHQGQHLVSSLRAALNNLPPPRFIPKRRQLNILISGKNSARLNWGTLSFDGYIPLLLKNWIDKHYIKSF